MADTQAVRRGNLRRLVAEHEGMNNLAKKLGMGKGAYISQLLTDPPVRQISEKTARKWEQVLRLPDGWLDGQPRAHGAQEPAINAALLAQAIAAVTAALEGAKVTLSAAKFAELVAMQYADAAATGKVDGTRVQAIVGFLKR